MTHLLTYTLVLSLAMPASLRAGAIGAQTPAASTPSSPAAGPPDGGWPRAYTAASGARIVIYEPQVASWKDQKHIAMYSAVSYTASGGSMPVLGTIRVEADTKVAVAERLVNF